MVLLAAKKQVKGNGRGPYSGHGGARVKTGAKMRNCINFLHCGRRFMSHGPHHRMCVNCLRLDAAGPFDLC